MIQIHRVEFVNFGPFESYAVDVPVGAIGIVGRNGKGKTSFILNTYATLTGDFRGFPGGTKESAIRDTAPEESAAHGEVEFSAAGQRFVITRYLRSSRVTLKCLADGKTLKSAADVKARMLALGVNERALKTSVFLTRPGSVFEMTSGQTADLYRDLCGTAAIGRLAEIIRKRRSADPRFQMVSVDVAAAEEFARATTELDDATVAVTSASVGLLPEAEASRIEKAIAAYDAAATAAERRKDAEARLAAARVLVPPLTTKANLARQAADDARAALALSVDDADAARAAILSAASAKQTLKARADAQAVLALPLPVPPTVPPKLTELRALAADGSSEAALRDAVAQQLALANATKAKVSGVCPTCGETPKDQAAFAKRVTDKVAELAPKAKAAKEARATVVAYDQAKARYDQAKAGADAKAAAARETLASLPMVDIPEEGAIAVWQSIIDAHTKARTTLTTAEATSRAADDAESRATAAVARIEAELAGITTTHATVVTDAVRRSLASHRAAVPALAAAKARLAAAEQTLVRATSRHERYLQDRESMAGVERLNAAVTRVEAAFHWSQLGSAVAGQFGQRLKHYIDEGLNLLGRPFTLSVRGDEMAMFVTYPNGKTRPAAAMSSGERGIAAVAFWSAVSRVFSAGPSLLVLDEPTANLDAQNVRLLRDALARFVEQTRGRQQMMIVTHADDLRPVFDCLIDLDRVEQLGR